MAVIFKNLMLRLGFNKFYLQGGDWGSVIVAHLASFFPDKYIILTLYNLYKFDKLHTNMRHYYMYKTNVLTIKMAIVPFL